MNKLFLLLSVVFGVLFIAGNALATVGGPTLIHSFKYNPADESVYYIQNNQNGRGCPPELMKISLNSGQSQVVFSCDQGEKLIEGNGYQFSPVIAEINKRVEGFKDLTPINLKDNEFSINISFINYEKLSPEVDEIKNANFIASVYHNAKKVVDLPLSGCNLKQPFVFAGYAIPGFEKKIVLLLSTKGDCFEGGYIDESLHVVGGVSNLDKKYYPNAIKESSALVPNEGTLVVYAGADEPIVEKTPETAPLPSENSRNNDQIFYVVAIILGLGLGYLLGRKRGV